MFESVTFGITISSRRKELRFTQEQLLREHSALLGFLSAQDLNDLEHDRRDPRDERLLKALCRVLQLSYDTLLKLASEHDCAAEMRRDRRRLAQYQAVAFRARFNRG